MPGRAYPALAALLALALASACGAPCENVISAQRSIRDMRAGPADGRPHAQLRFPHNRINVLLASALEREEVGVELPLSTALPLPAASARASRIEIRSARDGALGFYVEVDLSLGESKLLSLSAVIEARARAIVGEAGSAIEIGFDADSLRSVEPEYPAGALDAIGAVIGPAVKAATGRTIPGPLLRPVTRKVFNFITTQAFELIRDQVLARVGEVARLRIDMGQAPIERIEMRSARTSQPALLINIFSNLPVRSGLEAVPPTADPISGTGRLRIAGEALAELGNWAIAENLAPQSYDSKLRPDPDGAYVPVYSWRQNKLPLVIHAFRIKSPCSTITIGARPEVRVEDGKITVGVADGNVEKVEGSSIIRLGVGLKSIFSGAIEKTESGPANASFEIGGRPVTARLIDANLSENELDLTIELSLAASAPGASETANLSAR